MAMRIGDACIGCSGCVDTCPTEAISLRGDAYEIDRSRCTECAGVYRSPACAEACPTECIVAEPAPPKAGRRLRTGARPSAAS